MLPVAWAVLNATAWPGVQAGVAVPGARVAQMVAPRISPPGFVRVWTLKYDALGVRMVCRAFRVPGARAVSDRMIGGGGCSRGFGMSGAVAGTGASTKGMMMPPVAFGGGSVGFGGVGG